MCLALEAVAYGTLTAAVMEEVKEVAEQVMQDRFCHGNRSCAEAVVPTSAFGGLLKPLNNF